MIVDVNGTRVDIKHYAAIFLQNVHELGGSANTRDIAMRSGLATWQVNEAFKQTEDMGLAEFAGYDTASRGPGSDPKLFELTGTGRQLVERGVPGKVITLNQTDAKLPEQELDDLKDWVARVEGRVNAAEQTDVTERFDEFRSKLDKAKSVEDVKDDLRDLEKYVIEWNEAAEKTIRAMRRALEDQGVDLSAYIVEEAEASN